MIWSELDRWQPAVISEDFDRKLYARIDRHDGRNWWQRFLAAAGALAEGRPFVSVAATCLIIVVGIVLQSPEKTKAVAPQQESLRLEVLEPEQVERGLEDLEMLKQLSTMSSPARM